MSRLEDMGMRVFTGAEGVMSSVSNAIKAAGEDAIDSIKAARASSSLMAQAVRAHYKPGESEAWRTTYDAEFMRVVRRLGGDMNGSMVTVPDRGVGISIRRTVGYTLSAVSSAACFWHGLKRNDSIGWGALWSIGGGIFPVALPLYAVYQGYAKPEALPKAGWTVKKGLGLQ